MFLKDDVVGGVFVEVAQCWIIDFLADQTCGRCSARSASTWAIERPKRLRKKRRDTGVAPQDTHEALRLLGKR